MDEMLMKGESVGFLKKGKAVAEMSCAFQRVVLFYVLTSLCLGRLCTIYMASFETSPPFTFFLVPSYSSSSPIFFLPRLVHSQTPWSHRPWTMAGEDGSAADTPPPPNPDGEVRGKEVVEESMQSRLRDVDGLLFVVLLVSLFSSPLPPSPSPPQSTVLRPTVAAAVVVFRRPSRATFSRSTMAIGFRSRGGIAGRAWDKSRRCRRRSSRTRRLSRLRTSRIRWVMGRRKLKIG